MTALLVIQRPTGTSRLVPFREALPLGEGGIRRAAVLTERDAGERRLVEDADGARAGVEHAIATSPTTASPRTSDRISDAW